MTDDDDRRHFFGPFVMTKNLLKNMFPYIIIDDKKIKTSQKKGPKKCQNWNKNDKKLQKVSKMGHISSRAPSQVQVLTPKNHTLPALKHLTKGVKKWGF